MEAVNGTTYTRSTALQRLRAGTVRVGQRRKGTEKKETEGSSHLKASGRVSAPESTSIVAVAALARSTQAIIILLIARKGDRTEAKFQAMGNFNGANDPRQFKLHLL